MLGGNFGSYEHFTYSLGPLVGHHGGEGEGVLHVGVKGEGPIVLVEDGLRVWDPRVIPHDKNGSLGVLLPHHFLQSFLPWHNYGLGDRCINDTRFVVSGKEKGF